MTDFLPDLCDRYGDQLLLLPQALAHYGGKTHFYGKVVTVQCFEDNSRVKEILATDGRGKVLVVDGGGATRQALLGDMIAQSAIDHGWQGVIIYGAIRDVAQLKQMDLGVLALASSPFKTTRLGKGVAHLPLQLAGVEIQPNAYVYVDLNGAVMSSTQLAIEPLNCFEPVAK